MLGTKKLLYILPDVAYSAELLPDKKPLSFAIQSCVQVNGSFIEDKVFNVANLNKLFSKLDANETYQLILPDDLFVNVILAIKETSDSKIKDELKEKILPGLSLLQETHTILTTVLNELRGTSRVQLSAINKELLAPLRAVAANSHIEIEHIAPLSWSLKSIVSLEPSVVVLQMGTMLYGSLHYIGVEQCFTLPTTDLDAVTEKIKAMKAAESSIMTCYLVTNALVEAGLKSGLKQVLPIQQMADAVKDREDLPAAVATIIEESMRTLSIPDFPVPQFMLDKASAEEVQKYALVPEVNPAVSKGDAMPKATHEEPKVEKKSEEELPKPHVLPTGGAVVASADKASDEKVVSLDESEEDEKVEEVVTAEPSTSKTVEKTSTEAIEQPVVVKEPMVSLDKKSATEPTPVSAAVVTPPVVSSTSPEPAIDLRQFAGAQSMPTATTEAVKPIPIKNKSRSMTKMITITLLVFIGTIAAGVGFGMLFLNYTNKTSDSTPVVEVQASPTPMATVEPTPEAATESAMASGSAKPATSSATPVSSTMAKLKILVVNATSKAGYAGQMKDKLIKAGFKGATAGNAKGEYTEAGDFVYQKKSDEAALTSLEKASGLSLTSDDVAKQEDTQGTYDIVVVLNQ